MNRLDLPYHADVLALFERLRSLPNAALLHSSDRQSPRGRYDIMAADPVRTVTYDKGVLRIGNERISTLKPLDVLRRRFTTRADATHPHFRSGFIGYFGYGLQHTLERLPEGPVDTTALPPLWGGDYGWAVVTDHAERTTSLWYGPEVSALRASELRRRLMSGASGRNGAFCIGSHYAATTSDATYLEAFDAIKHYINEGDCYQVNLARHYVAGLRGDVGSASWAAYTRLVKSQPVPFGAYLATPFGHVVCLSPERFIKYTNESIETSPIKGTAPRFEDASRDIASADRLRRSGKDRAENLMIVDLLRNDLGRICRVGSVRTEGLFRVETFANVHHLVSTVRGSPRPHVDAWSALIAAFPGGSVTGAPKIRAMQIINELEPLGRSVYCGSIGYVDHTGAMDTNIAIRTLAFTPTGVHCWGGGGVVADSVASLEISEINHKIGALLQVTAGLAISSSCSAS
jgi:para-aminobenzoate synthetase component 1